jgi:hypothetical protein
MHLHRLRAIACQKGTLNLGAQVCLLSMPAVGARSRSLSGMDNAIPDIDECAEKVLAIEMPKNLDALRLSPHLNISLLGGRPLPYHLLQKTSLIWWSRGPNGLALPRCHRAHLPNPSHLKDSVELRWFQRNL